VKKRQNPTKTTPKSRSRPKGSNKRGIQVTSPVRLSEDMNSSVKEGQFFKQRKGKSKRISKQRDGDKGRKVKRWRSENGLEKLDSKGAMELTSSHVVNSTHFPKGCCK